MTFHELVSVLRLTKWWNGYLFEKREDNDAPVVPGRQFEWFASLAGAILGQHSEVDPASSKELAPTRFAKVFEEWIFGDLPPAGPTGCSPCLWSVSLNRPAACSVTRSTLSIKADATRRLFDVDGSGIRWAVLDSGIDASHRAFRRVKPSGVPYGDGEEGSRGEMPTRVVETYDFTRLRSLLSLLEVKIASGQSAEAASEELFSNFLETGGRAVSKAEARSYLVDIERALKQGRTVDWSVLQPFLRIPHRYGQYVAPKHPHGTHVAGIIGADMRPWDGAGAATVTGVCPGIELYDLRVFDDQGRGDEFAILAALQFVRWLNKRSEHPLVNGVNLSLSLVHRVVNYACGCTPVCEECERVVSDGIVTVAAAGNRGRAVFRTADDVDDEGFRTVSITDPGNADGVITVGATHRNKPHSYGVSYFSSRGPTGDGRIKPDLLAPGEKVTSTVPGDGFDTMDGTSMAAPHVSGAAALLLARNRELIGRPRRIKEILCKSATDLGRERYFQGHGMLDVLRAMQSI